ncbi:MAG: hypothetical protein M3497_00590, partial [Gemmatimonadota bacterium]|nr:hypothetical protein [Gemmatimonadota bacterium]
MAEASLEAPKTAATGDGGRLRRVDWLVLAICGAWAILLSFVGWPALIYRTFVSNSSIDSAFFALAGDLLRSGGTPYVTYWDHKPPLIHLINAAGLTLSGGHVWGVWFMSLTAVLTALGLGYRALRHAFGVPGALLGITYFVFSLPGILAFNLTEWYALPLQWASVLLLVRWNPDSNRDFFLGFGLGILATLGFLLRANLIGAAVSVGLALSVVLLFRGRIVSWLRLVAGATTGVLLVAAALLVYL